MGMCAIGNFLTAISVIIQNLPVRTAWTLQLFSAEIVLTTTADSVLQHVTNTQNAGVMSWKILWKSYSKKVMHSLWTKCTLSCGKHTPSRLVMSCSYFSKLCMHPACKCLLVFTINQHVYLLCWYSQSL